MKRDMLFLFFCTILIVLLPGCGRIIDWGKDNFYQGCEVNKNVSAARSYIKSKRVYDQFSLVGAFDVLWLSDAVRKTYVDLYARKYGKNEEQKQVFLRRQLEENNHFITFYVLNPKNIILGEKDSYWSILLKVGDKVFTPIEQKVIDVSSEYIDIFGKKYNQFKDVYLVYFNAKDIENNFLIDKDTRCISLLFRSHDKDITLCWGVPR